MVNKAAWKRLNPNFIYFHFPNWFYTIITVIFAADGLSYISMYTPETKLHSVSTCRSYAHRLFFCIMHTALRIFDISLEWHCHTILFANYYAIFSELLCIFGFDVWQVGACNLLILNFCKQHIKFFLLLTSL